MAINFTQAPDTNPFQAPAAGFYKFKIIKAEMRAPKDTTKKDYLSLQIAIYKVGKKVGTIFEGVYESDAPALLYKTKRLVQAIGLDLNGSVELKDLSKLLVNKEGILELEQVKDNKDRDVARVKTFGSECYWSLSEAKELLGEAAQVTESKSEVEEDTDEDVIFDDSEISEEDY